jgi:hypothetical protein
MLPAIGFIGFGVSFETSNLTVRNEMRWAKGRDPNTLGDDEMCDSRQM